MVRSVVCLLLAGCAVSTAAAPGGDPFYLADRNPLLMSSGLPAREPATLLSAGTLSVAAFFDIASNATDTLDAPQEIILDGESTQLDIRLRYGLHERWELGADLVWLRHSAGQFDGFIDHWHDFFGLPAGDRAHQPRDRLLYSYRENGQSLFALRRPTQGMGDVRLSAAYQVFARDPSSLALRAGIDLPTGDAGELLGSGGTDAYLELSYGRDVPRAARMHRLHGGIGILRRGSGEILPNAERPWVGYGFAAIDWPLQRYPIHLKAQLNVHSAMYDTAVHELGSDSVQLALGGTALLGPAWSLDIAVSEDLLGETPDVALQLALRYQRNSSQSKRNSRR